MNEKWVDVSAHQGHIDWSHVAASGITGAILRAGYGNDVRQQDTQFAANIKGALASGLNVGIYWFSYADSISDVRKEWAACKQIISPYHGKIILPVVCDYEYDSVKYYKRVHGTTPSNTLINSMVNTFLSAAKADGWNIALYTNNDYRRNVFSIATLAAYDIWLADYTGGPDVPCAIQQTGSTGSIPGISGNVDIDVAFKDYSDLLVTKTAVKIDTTGTFNMLPGEIYTIKTLCDKVPKLWAATENVVKIMHCRRDGNADFWHAFAVGKVGSGTGVFTAAPGEQGQRRLIVNIVEKK